MTSLDIRVARYEPQLRNQVLRLMALVQQHETSPEEFTWWFENNPLKLRNIFLAFHNQELVGVSCHNSFKVLHNKIEKTVSFPLNVLTHPDFRGRGIFSLLEKANEELAVDSKVPFMLSFPNAASTPIFVHKLGWNTIRVPMLFGKPLRADNLARRLFRSPSLSRGFNVLNPLFGRSANLEGLGLTAVEIQHFESDIEDVYRASENILPTCFARGLRYLNWRYTEDPNQKYRSFALKRESRTVGYVVTGISIKMGIRVGYIASSLVIAEYRNKMYRIHEAFNGYHKEAGSDLILCWPDMFYTNPKSCLVNGYLPLCKRFNFIFKQGCHSGQDPVTKPPDRWFLQLGDLDFF